MSLESPDKAAVKDYLLGLQERIVAALEIEDGTRKFFRDAWQREPGDALNGGGISSVLQGGSLFEQAGVEIHDAQDANDLFARMGD